MAQAWNRRLLLTVAISRRRHHKVARSCRPATPSRIFWGASAQRRSPGRSSLRRPRPRFADHATHGRAQHSAAPEPSRGSAGADVMPKSGWGGAPLDIGPSVHASGQVSIVAGRRRRAVQAAPQPDPQRGAAGSAPTIPPRVVDHRMPSRPDPLTVPAPVDIRIGPPRGMTGNGDTAGVERSISTPTPRDDGIRDGVVHPHPPTAARGGVEKSSNRSWSNKRLAGSSP